MVLLGMLAGYGSTQAWSCPHLDARQQASTDQSVPAAKSIETLEPNSADRVRSAVLGLDGHIRLGCWTEVRLSCLNPPTKGQMIVQAMDGDANWVDYRWPLHHVTSSDMGLVENSAERQEVVLVGLFRLGRPRQPVTVTIRDGAGQVWAEVRLETDEASGTRVHAANDRIWVYLGPDLNLGAALGWSASDRQPGSHRLLTIDSAAKLPQTVWGWDAIERLVGCTDNETWPTEMSVEQRLALGQWMVDGGRISLALNQSWDTTLSPGGAFGFLLPNLLTQQAETADSSQVELLVSSRSQLISDPRSERLPYRGFGTEREQAILLVDRQPVLVRRSCGLGQVDLLGLDPTIPLLEKWPSRGALLTRWLDYRRGETARLNTAFGYNDVSGQMRSSLEQFTQVKLISFTSVALIVIGFVGLLAADYFLLKHLLGAMHWTWLTLPLYCLIACLATWGLFHASKPAVYQLNFAEVIDIDATGGHAQLQANLPTDPAAVAASPNASSANTAAPSAIIKGHWWASLYSPSADELRLSVAPEIAWGIQPLGATLGWLGLPGSGMGGMQSENQLLHSAKHYRVEGQWDSRAGGTQHLPALNSSEQDVPFFVASSRVLTGSWTADFGPVQSNLQKQVGRDRLIGTITNPLPVELKDCFIVYGTWGYRLSRPLGPGETVDMDINKNQTKPESFEDWLRRPNPDMDNLHRILELVTFHEQAGGKVQTRLLPGYQDRLDLSQLSRLDRAILFGRCDRGVLRLQKNQANFETDELDRKATAVRIILPVGRSE